MSIPPPYAGLVLRYSYLWRRQYLAGREDGDKDRPCAIVLCVRDGEQRRQRVIVVPVTHKAPSDAASALEIPIKVRRRLGLDGERCWIILNEGNSFLWPGPDLRRIEPSGSFVYGELPPKFFDEVIDRLRALMRSKGLLLTHRPH